MNSALLPVSVLTAGGSSAAAGGGGLFMMIIYMVIIFGAMYFFAIRPQKKEQKRLQTMISQMEVGDTVVTTSGFYGIVIAVDEEDCIVEFGNNKNCRIPMRKSAIAEIEKASDSAPASSEPEKTTESAAPKKAAVKGPRAAAREAKEAMKQARIQEKEKAVEENKAAREARRAFRVKAGTGGVMICSANRMQEYLDFTGNVSILFRGLAHVCYDGMRHRLRKRRSPRYE